MKQLNLKSTLIMDEVSIKCVDGMPDRIQIRARLVAGTKIYPDKKCGVEVVFSQMSTKWSEQIVLLAEKMISEGIIGSEEFAPEE